MRKGQAFDTFKLMIAAVVAVAILGILMTILLQITIPGQSFDDTARNLLTKAVGAPGIVYPSTGDITFVKDAIYPGTAFEDTTGGTVVEFKCDNIGLCEPGDLGSQLTISANFKSKIYVTCTSTKCCIFVGATGTCT